jgi:hypothetical protein
MRQTSSQQMGNPSAERQNLSIGHGIGNGRVGSRQGSRRGGGRHHVASGRWHCSRHGVRRVVSGLTDLARIGALWVIICGTVAIPLPGSVSAIDNPGLAAARATGGSVVRRCINRGGSHSPTTRGIVVRPNVCRSTTTLRWRGGLTTVVTPAASSEGRSIVCHSADSCQCQCKEGEASHRGPSQPVVGVLIGRLWYTTGHNLAAITAPFSPNFSRFLHSTDSLSF